jgi:hypothetical protein
VFSFEYRQVAEFSELSQLTGVFVGAGGKLSAGTLNSIYAGTYLDKNTPTAFVEVRIK